MGSVGIPLRPFHWHPDQVGHLCFAGNSVFLLVLPSSPLSTNRPKKFRRGDRKQRPPSGDRQWKKRAPSSGTAPTRQPFVRRERSIEKRSAFTRKEILTQALGQQSFTRCGLVGSNVVLSKKCVSAPTVPTRNSMLPLWKMPATQK